MKAARVPEWLQHLRTDRRGLPVPYINLWGPEGDESRISIKLDRHIGWPGVFYDDTGEDTPDFTRQNMGRQRECMMAGLCQVCGKRIPWSGRYLVVSDLSVSWVTLGGRETAVITEPWLCGPCGRFAVEYCPALIRRERSEHLTVIPVTSPLQVDLVVSRGWVEGPLEALSRSVQPGMWVKLFLPGVTIERSRS